MNIAPSCDYRFRVVCDGRRSQGVYFSIKTE